MFMVGNTSGDLAQADRLAGLVETAFPALRLGERRLDRSGGDHVLLIVDERFAFRFPRSGMHGLKLELAVLERLRRHSSLPTPAYQYVDPEGRFAGYPLIQGSALTPARFDTLSKERQQDVLRTAATFLTELHALAPDMIAPVSAWPRAWTASEYARRASIDHLPRLAVQIPAQAKLIARFCERYRTVASPRLVVIHGDLVVEHVLLDDRTEQLSGIIDFGDVALGDPAQDFLGFWDYGAAAAARVVELYRSATPDPDLLTRSHDHFVRYRLNRILAAKGRGALDAVSVAAEIDTLLT